MYVDDSCSLAPCGPVMNLPLVQGVTLAQRQCLHPMTAGRGSSGPPDPEVSRSSYWKWMVVKNLCASNPNSGVVTSSHVCHSFYHTISSDPAKIKAMRTCGRENKRKSSEQRQGSKLTWVLGVRLNSLRPVVSLYTLTAELRGNQSWQGGGTASLSAHCVNTSVSYLSQLSHDNIWSKDDVTFLFFLTAPAHAMLLKILFSDTQHGHVFLIWSVCSKWW